MAVSFSRTTEGLIFRDQFDRSDDPNVGNGWSKVGSGASLVSLTDMQIEKDAGDIGGIRQDVGGSVASGDLICQVNFRPGSDRHGIELNLKLDLLVGFNNGYFFQADDAGFGSPTKWEIISRKASSDSTLISTSGSPSFGQGNIFAIRASIEGANCRLLYADITSLTQLDTDFTAKADLTDPDPPTSTGDIVGARIRNSVGDLDEFFVCGKYVSVSGLPTGWKVQVDSRTAVEESGGSVSIDVDTWALPATTIKILDDGDVEQETLTPGTGIWGGDAYAYVANTQPDKPTISVDDVTDTTADLSSSAFSDPDVGDVHESSQWQVDLATGDFSSPVADSGEDMVNLLSITSTGLTPSTQYKARVRHKDDSGNPASEWSEWSDPTSFTTNTFSEPEEPASTSYTTVTPPATSYSSCAEPTSASWSSCVEADETSWSSCPTPTATSWSSC